MRAGKQRNQGKIQRRGGQKVEGVGGRGLMHIGSLEIRKFYQIGENICTYCI